MTLADLTIGCKVVVSVETGLQDGSDVSSTPLRRIETVESESQENVVKSVEAVVCTAWPSEVVPQFAVVPAEETKKELGITEKGRFLVLVFVKLSIWYILFSFCPRRNKFRRGL